MNAHTSVTALRLSPAMASFRLLVYAYVRDYIELWEVSPSYGEIAAALDTNVTRVKRAARSLERDGLVMRTGGPRGLVLPSALNVAIRRLRSAGYAVDKDIGRVAVPGPKATLLPPAELTYPSRCDPREVVDGKQGGKAAGSEARRAP